MYVPVPLDPGRMRCVATHTLPLPFPGQNLTGACTHSAHGHVCTIGTSAEFAVDRRCWDGVPPDSIRELSTSAAFLYILGRSPESLSCTCRDVVPAYSTTAYSSSSSYAAAPSDHSLLGRGPPRARGANRPAQTSPRKDQMLAHPGASASTTSTMADLSSSSMQPSPPRGPKHQGYPRSR